MTSKGSGVFNLHSNLENDAGVVVATQIRGAVEIACFVVDQVAERVQTVGSAGKNVKRVVRPCAVHARQLIDRAGVVGAIAMSGSVNLCARGDQNIAKRARNAPSW